jgi:hypothetical protein
MRRKLSLLALLAAVACWGILGDTALAGGRSQTFNGVSFTLPAGWQAVPKNGLLFLVPKGANPTGVVEELYVLAKSESVRQLDGAEAGREVDKFVAVLLPGARRQGDVTKARFGELDGRVSTFRGKAGNGRAAEVRVYGFVGTTFGGLAALGYPDALARRDADVQALLGSLRKAADNGAASAVLAGRWNYLAQVNLNNGGRQTNSWIQLNADGTYEFFWEVSSSGPNGLAGTLNRHRGTWSATDTALTLKATSGKVFTYRLEKRNHPRNRQDPMILLDGRAYVTATRRNPW